MPDQGENLERLAKMLDEGKITDEEYARLKAEVLSSLHDFPVPPAAPTSSPPHVGDTPNVDSQTRWWLIGTGVLMAVGSFLPWVQAGIFSVAGTDGDGIFTLVGGVAITLIGIANKATAITGIGAIVVAGFSTFIAGNVISNLSDLELGSLGSGVILTLLASLFALIAGFKVFNQRAR